MPRNLSAAAIAQLSAGQIKPCFFCQIQFASGTIYLWSGYGSITWNSQTWSGVGTLGQISACPETADVAAQNVTLSLSGIDSTLLADAIGQCRTGLPVQLWFGFLDSSGNVVASPFECFGGFMDAPTVTEGGETSTISISVENRLVDLNRSKERRYTQADQVLDYPSDIGFQFVPAIQDWNGVWGQPGSASGTGLGGSATGPHGDPDGGHRRPGQPI